MDYQKYLDFNLWGNSGEDYLQSILIFVGALLVFKIAQVIIIKRIESVTQKTETDIDDFMMTLIKSIKPPFYFLISIYLASRFLEIKEIISKFIDGVIFIAVVLQLILIAQRIIDYVSIKIIQKTTRENGEMTEDEIRGEEAVVRTVGRVVKFIIWAMAILFVLSNMGVNVTSALAGLGIGGIAIAMASKDILSDIIAAITIFIDKPFKVGQFVQVGDNMGTVEYVGAKTTRIKTLQGEELIIPNQELANSRVQNYKRMEKRRVVFNLGVVYGTKLEKLKKIPNLVKEIVEKVENTEFDRSNFATYGDFSLNFENVYYINTADYNEYMNIQEKINLAIYEKFEEEGIEFAYPTQTVIVSSVKG
ncbi:MAG: mechanosensitive ion channel family protein [Candidatus Moranbacteria bacterium]|nr:mechanosensitive ion channel family protein [Candidatus Moranbacteria bacterium]